MAPISCGIDFGTSNSTCALVQDGIVGLVPLEGSALTIPSAIFYAADKNIYFGRDAIDAYIEGDEGRLMRSLKMVLGTSLIDERTRIGSRSIKFTDILGAFLRHIKSKAETNAGQDITDVVMGRPVHFHDDDTASDALSENALLQIAQSVGFKNIRFQFEPIAAAFAHEKKLQDEELSLIVDLGGGTSDFTVIRMSPHRKIEDDRTGDILSTAGIRVGGTHFDERLSMKDFMPPLGLGSEYRDLFNLAKIMPAPMSVYANLSSWPKVHFAQTAAAIRETEELIKQSLEPKKLEKLLSIQKSQGGHAYLQAVERAKIALTEHQTHTEIFKKLDIHVPTTRQGFESSINGEITRISGAITQCLRDAGVAENNIKRVVLTGGSTELPVINHLIAQRFAHAHISKDDKFGSVGTGLGHYAQSTFR